MLFTVIRHDKPNSVALRMSARPKHLVYLERVQRCIASGGAILNDNNEQVGSILMIDVADPAAAEEFAATDPFVAAGLFASTVIAPFRPVFSNGERI